MSLDGERQCGEVADNTGTGASLALDAGPKTHSLFYFEQIWKHSAASVSSYVK